ncbi:MAG: hypothetical protein RLZZ528_1657 [Pseudomonadota bacterium]|jgi:uncharacterized membrane protein
MSLRSARERVFQTLCFEVGGLLVATPLYALVVGASGGESLLVVAAMSVAVMIWSPLHNTAFDWAEWRLAGRVASDRPQKWRIIHAMSHELTAMAVTLPILLGPGGLGFGEAVLADLGLTALYTAYAYGFHMVFDRLRPVRPRAG